jgi:hypothetical protein
MSRDDAVILRRKAETCLRLISSVSDLRTLKTLRELADELLAKADAAEGKVGTAKADICKAETSNTDAANTNAPVAPPLVPTASDDPMLASEQWLAGLRNLKNQHLV